ncbi:hypothetical protein RH831_00515 [Halodesulfurarchaeum sp. HSR-GB]|uniref:DUF7560 family zinc ribbon protein n=1 Tax=Halodesulfurarchaeum sp. HSR-GB TaxID=3074077 RepID=UPI0028657BF4|nr:hypothetical protein [Halodesulfurarchaeum sp. HSR-GB]MDR5655666.1 hypothetical protein [Halodesulfurarchaeum sp. HSR-GB]
MPMFTPFRVVCPGCGLTVLVDAKVRGELLADGCVRCQRELIADDFHAKPRDVTARSSV